MERLAAGKGGRYPEVGLEGTVSVGGRVGSREKRVGTTDVG